MSRRQIKKSILAEALKLYREHDFPVRGCTLRKVAGTYSQLVHTRLERPYDVLTDLMHECGRLEGDRP